MRKILILVFVIVFMFAGCSQSGVNTDNNTDTDSESVFSEDNYKEPVSFPVLMYHTSSEEDPAVENADGRIVDPDLFIKPSEFDRQIKYLIDNNYNFCIFDDWYSLYNIENPVFITFDDGYIENYTEIFPVLQKYQKDGYDVKITIFLVTEPAKKEILTPEIIREMSDSGLVKFESHTVTHANLAEISGDSERLERELRDSKSKIERQTGRTVHAISYPGGGYNQTVTEKAGEFYQFGISTDWGFHRTDISDFKIRRLAVGRNASIEDFARLLRKE
ncbi:MAG: polysaccharide deacetylase family protein [Oscillospiraceae bacterium]|nr:polysaccharide deacetylase family protein [Oscillospiraceae bacterium]